LPKRQQNDRSAYTLLTLAGLGENTNWSSATNKIIGIHDIMIFISKNYGYQYAENSRESIRRQTIHQFEQAGMIERNRDKPDRPTNSGKTVYSLTNELLKVLRSFGSGNWDEEKKQFLDINGSLSERYAKKRVMHKIPVKIDGFKYEMSSGKHNDLQKAIIEEFATIFAQGSELLYLGDTANKHLFIKEQILVKLGIPITKHDKLPDVVLYDATKNWLFLCEAVTSHGPFSAKRIMEIEAMLKDCHCGRIYVSCFPNKQTFKKHIDDLAWETEIWFRDNPTHMMHLNGDRFLGPK